MDISCIILVNGKRPVKKNGAKQFLHYRYGWNICWMTFEVLRLFYGFYIRAHTINMVGQLLVAFYPSSVQLISVRRNYFDNARNGKGLKIVWPLPSHLKKKTNIRHSFQSNICIAWNFLLIDRLLNVEYREIDIWQYRLEERSDLVCVSWVGGTSNFRKIGVRDYQGSAACL